MASKQSAVRFCACLGLTIAAFVGCSGDGQQDDATLQEFEKGDTAEEQASTDQHKESSDLNTDEPEDLALESIDKSAGDSFLGCSVFGQTCQPVNDCCPGLKCLLTSFGIKQCCNSLNPSTGQCQ